MDVRELDPKTLMSHKHNQLYFFAEQFFIDVDGDCGGAGTSHFAWASGYVSKSLAFKKCDIINSILIKKVAMTKEDILSFFARSTKDEA